MNKKLLFVGLSSGLLLASCGASTSAVSKKVNFKEIITKGAEIELLKGQVVEGFNYISSVKAKSTYTDYYFNSKDAKESKIEKQENNLEFFSNGYINKASYSTTVDGSKFDEGSYTYKTAVTNDTVYLFEEDSDAAYPFYEKTKLDLDSGESKETWINSYKSDLGSSVFSVDALFGEYGRTRSYNYERSVVGKISDKKIGAYYEYKWTYVLNTDEVGDSNTYTQVESGYYYMEAKLVGDVYQISKFEQKEQLVGNYYDGGSRSRESMNNPIKLDKYEVLSESETSFKLKYNKDMSEFTESSELTDLVTSFPTWFIDGDSISISANVYLPEVDPETKEITGVSWVTYVTINPLNVSDDMHSFEAALTNASSKYLIQFVISANVKTYDEEGTLQSYYFNEPVDVTNGASYGETVIDEEKYYKGNPNKVYNFSVKFAFNPEAEDGEEVSVAEFKIA